MCWCGIYSKRHRRRICRRCRTFHMRPAGRVPGSVCGDCLICRSVSTLADGSDRFGVFAVLVAPLADLLNSAGRAQILVTARHVADAERLVRALQIVFPSSFAAFACDGSDGRTIDGIMTTDVCRGLSRRAWRNSNDLGFVCWYGLRSWPAPAGRYARILWVVAGKGCVPSCSSFLMRSRNGYFSMICDFEVGLACVRSCPNREIRPYLANWGRKRVCVVVCRILQPTRERRNSNDSGFVCRCGPRPQPTPIGR